MEKQLVFVIQIHVPAEQRSTPPVGKPQEDYVRESLQDWARRCRGAYAATVQIDEVKVQGE